MLICFIGIDGSGKSTLARYLYEELKKRNYDVSYTWWLEGENSLFRSFLRRIGKSNFSDTRLSNVIRKKSIAIKIFKIIYPRIVLLDYLRFGIMKAWFPKVRGKIVIFDRFAYDVILGISKEFDLPNYKKERLLKMFSKLLPNPDLIFIVDAPPEVCYLRKSEEIKSIEDARQIWAEYQKFYSLLRKLTKGKIVKIDNTGNIVKTKAELFKVALSIIDATKDELK